MPSSPSVSRNLRTVSLCTLLSRVLGLLRDQGLAGYFGNGELLDSFTVAFRLPNLARMLLGEGALTTAFLPVFVEEKTHQGDDAARRLSTAVFLASGIVLCSGVMLFELILGAIYCFTALSAEATLLLQLTAVLLPYVIFICLAAQQCATLNALGQFIWPALVPVVLNAVWLFAMLTYVRYWTTPEPQLFVMCITVLIAGCLQFTLPAFILWRLGFGWDQRWREAWPMVKRIGFQMLPVLAGLSITQVNTLLDSAIAWGFARPEHGGEHLAWWDGVPYPLSAGTASALYFGQRLYQFPLGVFGVALGTVLFPLLTQHAQQKAWDRLRDDLTLGIRLVLAIGIPASVGLILLSYPLAESFFQYGRFDAEDTRQTAGMIAGYGAGVWAYCGLLILQRGFYAVGDRLTPLRVGLLAVILNVCLNLTLIWPMGGIGLALSTTFVAVIQCLITAWLMQIKIGQLDWKSIVRTLIKTMIATGLLAITCYATASYLQQHPLPLGRAARLGIPLLSGAAVYLLVAWFIQLEEPWLLLSLRRQRQVDTDSTSSSSPSNTPLPG